MEKTRIELGDKIVTLKFNDLDFEIDIENYTTIDHGNIIGEILTFPAFFAKIAYLRAEAMNVYEEKKADVRIYEAKQRKYWRNKLNAESSKRVSNQEVEDAMMIDEGYLQKHKQLANRQRDFEYLDAMYWAAKSKDGKLNNFSKNVTEDSLKDVVEGVINGIAITSRKPAMPKRG